MDGKPRKIIPILHADRAEEFWKRIDKRKNYFSAKVDGPVRRILRDVRLRGDQALLEYTEKSDHLKLHAEDLPVSPVELRRLAAATDPQLRMDFQKAVFNITAFHRRQLQKSWDCQHDGVTLGQRVTALESVGIYLPGGTAARSTSVLMTALPAKVAGVSRIVVVTPPGTLEAHPNLAAALLLLGIREVYRVGGAQAVAALALGTDTIPPVEKIIGPGDAYVNAAKRMLFGVVDIDMVSGPAELLVVADESASPRNVAADLLSQVEHEEGASAICLTVSRPQAALIQSEVERQLQELPRKDLAARALAEYGAIMMVRDLAEATGIINRFAPGRLELQVEDPERIARGVHHAGAIFLGPHTPMAVGDYFAGPSCVLPNCGTARFFSPLGVYDFQKFTNIIGYSEERLRQCRDSIERMAMAEDLQGNVRSIAMRFKPQEKDENPS